MSCTPVLPLAMPPSLRAARRQASSSPTDRSGSMLKWITEIWAGGTGAEEIGVGSVRSEILWTTSTSPPCLHGHESSQHSSFFVPHRDALPPHRPLLLCSPSWRAVEVQEERARRWSRAALPGRSCTRREELGRARCATMGLTKSFMCGRGLAKTGARAPVGGREHPRLPCIE
jgi:hypothetical protein